MKWYHLRRLIVSTGRLDSNYPFHAGDERPDRFEHAGGSGGMYDMPHRNFRAADGRSWEVWEVIPGGWRDQERRRAADRRSSDPIIAYKPDRRSGHDRRKSAPLVHGGLAGGWLAFESHGEKRRLAPVPAGWESFTDSALDELRSVAVPAPRINLI